MPGALDSLFKDVRSDQRGQLVRFLQERQGEWPAIGETVASQLYMAHRSIRPAELLVQSRFGLHPGLEVLRRWYEKTEAVYGREVHRLALADWADLMLQNRPVPPLLGEILEAWCLDQALPVTAAVLDDVAIRLIERTSEEGWRALTPMGVSVLLLVANETFGPPSKPLLNHAVRRFREVALTMQGTLPHAAFAIGSLLWRALDAGVIDAAEMRSFVEHKPELLRMLEGHLVLGTVRISALVPFRSASEQLVEQVCLERLETMVDDPGIHTPNGPLKVIPLWPGTEVMLRVLEHVEQVRQVTRNEYQNTAASSLWHILRHTRPCPDESLPVERLARFADSTLLSAAMVAPWWAGDIERVREWHGLQKFVAWAFAHANSALGEASDAMPEMPRIERQVREMIADLGLRTQRERNQGIYERQWFFEACESLGHDRAISAINQLQLAFRHTTHLREAALAMLGESRDEVWAGTREGRLRSIRMLGLLPLNGGDERPSGGSEAEEVRRRVEALRQQWSAFAEINAPQRRHYARRAVLAGATNIAETCSLSDPTMLAWEHGEACIEPLTFPLPVTLPKYTLVAVLDEDGQPMIGVIKRGKNTRLLKTVPRDIAALDEYKEARAGIGELKDFVDNLIALFSRRLITGQAIASKHMISLLEHPVAQIVVADLVFVEVGTDHEGFPRLGELQLGEPVKLELLGVDGTAHPLPEGAQLRLAHPIELEERRSLNAWRDALFAQGRRQPFPQLFREFEWPRAPGRAMKMTDYAGYRVVVPEAVESLNRLGWDVWPGQHPRRVLRDDDLVAYWPLRHRDMPSDLFRDAVGRTGDIAFYRLSSGEAVPVRLVSPTVLSEVVRDAVQVLIETSLPGESFPEPYLKMCEALAHNFAAHAAQKMHFDLPVTTHASPTRVTARVRMPGGKSAAIHVDLHSAKIEVEGTDVAPYLPESKEPMYVPHPLQDRLHNAFEQFMRVLEALQIEDRSIMDVLERL